MQYVSKSVIVAILLLTSVAKTFASPVFIMRHGQAQNNIQNLHSTDIELSKQFPLTDLGRAQVSEAAKKIIEMKTMKASEVDAVFVSPLLRTEQTAKILKDLLLIEDSKFKTHPLLAEGWLEEFDGKKQHSGWDELAHPEVSKGEGYGELASRLFILLGELCKKNYSGTIILVTHESPAAILEYLLTVFPTLPISRHDQQLLNRYVFSVRLKQLLFNIDRSPKTFKNAEIRGFDNSPFCELYRKTF